MLACVAARQLQNACKVLYCVVNVLLDCCVAFTLQRHPKRQTHDLSLPWRNHRSHLSEVQGTLQLESRPTLQPSVRINANFSSLLRMYEQSICYAARMFM